MRGRAQTFSVPESVAIVWRNGPLPFSFIMFMGWLKRATSRFYEFFSVKRIRILAFARTFPFAMKGIEWFVCTIDFLHVLRTRDMSWDHRALVIFHSFLIIVFFLAIHPSFNFSSFIVFSSSPTFFLSLTMIMCFLIN